MLNAARPEDIIFTSGGTEGNNLVLYTATRLASETAPAQPRVHIVSTTVEHDSVENMLQHLEATGWADVTRVAPRGGLQVDDIVAALRPETTLVTVMLANNETGTIFPVGEIASAVKAWAGERGQQILVHTDAAQVGTGPPRNMTNKLALRIRGLSALTSFVPWPGYREDFRGCPGQPQGR